MKVKKHEKSLLETRTNKIDNKAKSCVCLRNSIWFSGD